MKSESAVAELQIKGFSREEVASVLENSQQGGALSPEIVDDLMERSGGNPLFLNEYLIQMASEPCPDENTPRNA
ncbi:MAG: hypothetical protein R6W31_01825, partial [Bacteroidales bacterium]